MTTDNPILTVTGQSISLGRTDPRQIDILSTAHSLAQINRFCGHARRPYSVAEHSLLVCDIIKSQGGGILAQLAGLMHDGHESLVGDVSSPVKAELRQISLNRARSTWGASPISDYDILESAASKAFQAAFSLLSIHRTYQNAVRRADLIALATEKRDLMPSHPTPWPCLEGFDAVPESIVDLMGTSRCNTSWQQWRDAFITRFEELCSARRHADAELLSGTPNFFPDRPAAAA